MASVRVGVGLPRTTWVLAVAGFFVAVGFGVLIPVLTPFAETFGANKFQMGLVVSMFAFFRLVTSPVAPRIGRWMGERNAISVGMLIVAVSTAATALSTNLTMMTTLRGLGGIGSATFSVAAINLLMATAPESLRGRAAGLYQGGFLLGSMAGPALGGLLSAVHITAPFYFYAATLVVAAAICFFMLPARATPVVTHTAEPRPLGQVVRDIRYQAACTVAFGQGWQSFGVRNALIPVMVTEMLMLKTTWSGIAFAIAAVAQTAALVPFGRLTDVIGRRPIMIISGVVCGLSTAAMAWSDNIWVLIAWLCVYGVGAAAQGTAPTAAVADATGGRGGQPVAVFSMVTDVGSIVGPLVVGAIVDASGYPAGFAVGGAILLLGAVHAAFIPRELDMSFQQGRTQP